MSKFKINPVTGNPFDMIGIDIEEIDMGSIPVRTADGWGSLVPSESGSDADMFKATYDTNNNGIVDNSEKLGNNLPAYYAIESQVVHNTGNESINGIKTFNNNINVNAIQYDTTPTVTTAVEGLSYWDGESGTRKTVMKNTEVILNDGQELYVPYAKNGESVTITNGTLVYVFGATGNNPVMKIASNDNIDTACCTLAVATHNISPNEHGYYTIHGLVNDVNTDSFTAGDKLYLGLNGQPTNIIPSNNVKVDIGYCIRKNTNNGSIFVSIANDFHENIYVPQDLLIKCPVNKTLLLEHKVWDDLNFDPNVSGGNPSTLPDNVTIDNCFYKEFTSSNNQTCGSANELPHTTYIGGDLNIYPHLHIFLKNGESAGTTGVQFTVYWAMRENGTKITGSTILSATSAELTTSPNSLGLYNLAGFAGPTHIGAQLALRIARTGGNAGDVVVMTYGIHYPIDTIGSRQLGAK